MKKYRLMGSGGKWTEPKGEGKDWLYDIKWFSWIDKVMTKNLLLRLTTQKSSLTSVAQFGGESSFEKDWKERN